MKFSQAVLITMATVGVSKAQLAFLTGYSREHIHELLAGRRKWSREELAKVLHALGFAIESEVNDT